MDHNIADLLKDAFSEIDITDSLQIPPDMAEDVEDMVGACKLWTSDQGSGETFTGVCEQEESEASSDDSESESSNSSNTESTFFLSQEIDSDQVVNTMMAGAQQLDDTAAGCTAEEGNMQSDLETGASEKELEKEEHIKTLKSDYEPQMPCPESSKSQTYEETSSESDEEAQHNYSTAENSSGCDSLGNKDECLFEMCPREDMKQFTEEDQEQIEESLADYPSDLSNSETEESSENAGAQPFTLIGVSSCVEHFTDRMELLSNAENLPNKEDPDLDYNSGIKIMEDNLNSATADVDLSLQKATFAEDYVQEYLTDDRYTEEDAENKEDDEDLSDVNNPAGDISDSSSDDNSFSQEETHFIPTVMQENKKKHVLDNFSTEDMLKVNDDIGYNAKSPEKKKEKSNTESHHSIELVQSDTAIKKYDIYSDASENVDDIKNTITEVLWSSSLLTHEDNLRLEEYDWDLTGDESFMINLEDGENQEYTEEAGEELDIDDDDEGNKRDWELEKTRIEAFYQFYGYQAEQAEVKVERNHKVTFCLDQESSSECDEDSDSTGAELDSDLNTPDHSTLKPEVYSSESDEDPLEKPYYPERSKMQPKEQEQQEPANAPVKQAPYRNKCLAVLKSMLAFGLLTAMGIVSFWWATENMDWIH